jgi:hypothetical protein
MTVHGKGIYPMLFFGLPISQTELFTKTREKLDEKNDKHNKLYMPQDFTIDLEKLGETNIGKYKEIERRIYCRKILRKT